ncbi:MAG: BON domain-containing protein [Steroidobacteraceae bacterium]|nr:BON domain-containing protein [Steroidobacteraceae bacterium]
MAERRAQDDRNRERRGDPAPADELDESLEESQEAMPDEAPDVHARWWQDEAPMAETGSISDPDYEDYDPGPRTPWGPGYMGEGNYSSGDFSSDAPGGYDYGYAGSEGDAGMDEMSDEQHGSGRYDVGPYEESDEHGGADFRSGHGPFGRLQREFDERHLRSVQHRSDDTSWVHDRSASARAHADVHRHFGGPPGWRDAPDWADPSGFHAVHGLQAPHVRRGPKGYRRSDERILEEIYLQLLRAPHIDSSDVSVEVHEGGATLTGTVPERRMKHAVEDAAYHTWGVEHVDNRIRVRRQGG